MSKSIIPLSIPLFEGNEWQYVKECLDTSWVSTVGSYVTSFEQDICNYTGAKFAVACNSGTSALHIALLVAGVGPGHEVIVPTLTFIAPINAVRYVGAEPVFMDCEDFLNLDVIKTINFIENECDFINEQLINRTSKKQVKAILPVHVFGHPVDIFFIV